MDLKKLAAPLVAVGVVALASVALTFGPAVAGSFTNADPGPSSSSAPFGIPADGAPANVTPDTLEAEQLHMANVVAAQAAAALKVADDKKAADDAAAKQAAANQAAKSAAAKPSWAPGQAPSGTHVPTHTETDPNSAEYGKQIPEDPGFFCASKRASGPGDNATCD